MQGIGFATPSLGWIGGQGIPTHETTDGGASWNLATGIGENLNRVRMLGTNLGYAVGETVYKYTAETSGVTEETAAMIPGLAIGPNLPNPFSISTVIPYTLTMASRLRVTIHDVHGRTIRTLIDGLTPPGANALVWDGRDLNNDPVAAGVYWCRMEAGPTSEISKVLVVR